MKRLLLTIILSAAATAVISCGKDDSRKGGTASVKREVLKVMTFNVNVDKKSGDNSWANREQSVSDMITDIKPLIIGTQEAQAHEITSIVSHHPEYGWYGIKRDSGTTPETTTEYSFEEAMAVFWLKDSLEVLDKGTFWLSTTPDKPGKGWDANYNRTATWLHFKVKRSGLKFYMFNTHLDDSGKQARKEGIKLIVSKVKEINSAGEPMFITGDFNTTETNEVFDPLLRSTPAVMKSARTYASISDKDKNTFNNYTAPKSQIDHIFYAGNAFPYTFKVVDGQYAGRAFISDHFPVITVFYCPVK